MRTTHVLFALAVLMTQLARAQGHDADLAQVRVAMAEGRWESALGTLLSLSRESASLADKEVMASLMLDVGLGLKSSSRFAKAMESLSAALEVRAALHGTQDNSETARVLLAIGQCRLDLGQFVEGQGALTQALAMRKRLRGDNDHPDIAESLNELAGALIQQGHIVEALELVKSSLAMRQRLHGTSDHVALAESHNNVAVLLHGSGQYAAALPHFEAALAMWKRLHGGREHPDVARTLGNLARCTFDLGRREESLLGFRGSLDMFQTLHRREDHADVGISLKELGRALQEVGRPAEALPYLQAAWDMHRRIFGSNGHPAVVSDEDWLASCLVDMMEYERALPHSEAVLAEYARQARVADDPEVCRAKSNLGVCLLGLGDAAGALHLCEEALEGLQRHYGDRADAEIVRTMNNVAICLSGLGREEEARDLFLRSHAILLRLSDGIPKELMAKMLSNSGHFLQRMGLTEEALPRFQEALGMWKALSDGADREDCVTALSNLGWCYQALGRAAEALPFFEQALAMQKRLGGDQDSYAIAEKMSNLGGCMAQAGELQEGMTRVREGLSMLRRVLGDRDHPDMAFRLFSVAQGSELLGQVEEAQRYYEASVVMVERLRQQSQASGQLRQSYFDKLKDHGAFERLQSLALAKGKVDDSFSVAERSRSRALLDLLEEQHFDPLERAADNAGQRGDSKGRQRIEALRQELGEAENESNRLLVELTKLDDSARDDPNRAVKRQELLNATSVVTKKLRQLLDERARFVADILPTGKARGASEIRNVLGPGELLLVFTVNKHAAMVHAMGGKADKAGLQCWLLPNALAAVQDALPVVLSQASRSSVAPSRGRTPKEESGEQGASQKRSQELFSSLFPGELWGRIRSAKRVFIAAHGGLHRLPFELLVTGIEKGKPVYWLDNGPEIAYVPSGSALHWLRTRKTNTQIGGKSEFEILAVGDPEARGPERGAIDPIASDVDVSRLRNAGDLERVRHLPRLAGARAEAEAIVSAWTKSKRSSKALLGKDASEPAILELAGRVKYLHFACHGIAEEYAGRSQSMLVLSQPERFQPGDDGFLKLEDLLHGWKGRLTSCRLVVLSACRTNVGPMLRDEAPQALPLGFLVAGAPSVISSLWAVDDASTRDLMTEFYGRMAAAGTDRLGAFTKAKKALRAKFGDPYHWAPFMFMGIPD